LRSVSAGSGARSARNRASLGQILGKSHFLEFAMSFRGARFERGEPDLTLEREPPERL
jgi:hypothetical protein